MDVIDDPSSPNLAAIFEVPGISTDHIKLTIHDGQLHLYGERRAPYPTRVESFQDRPPLPFNALTLGDKMDTDSLSQVKVYVQEICFGTFQRSVPLPKGVKVTLFSFKFNPLTPLSIPLSLTIELFLTHFFSFRCKISMPIFQTAC